MNKIVYHNFAPKAAENAVFSSESSEFDYTAKLTEDKELVNFASFENIGINLLDETLCFAEGSDNVGFVSAQVSSNLKTYKNGGIKLIFDFNGYYTGPGITFHFGQNICPKLSVEFFRDEESLISKTVNISSHDYYVPIAAEQFNKLVITFFESEIPEQFVKLKGIDLGDVAEITEFFGAINIFEEISPDCSDLPFDTCDFKARVPEKITPQVGQNIFVYHGDKSFGKFTVAELVDEENRRFEFKTNCDKSTLGDCYFPSLSQSDYSVEYLAQKIKENSDVSIDCAGFEEIRLSGFVKADSHCRFAAAMMSMGGGFYISSARNTKLKLFEPRDRRENIITSDRILDKAKYQKNAPYTRLELLDPSGNALWSVNNTNVTGNISTKVLKYDKFSLFKDSDPKTRLEEIARLIGFERNEIKAEIVLDDERLGDIVRIETPYGIKTGIIKSLDITLQGSEKTANIVIIEVDNYNG